MIRLLLAFMALAAAPPAWAHAFLERAIPAVGSEVSPSPRELVLAFSEGVEPMFSSIELHNAQGVVVPIGKPASAPGDNRRVVTPLPGLPNGVYSVIWHVTSVDTHKTEGSFKFTVK
jgi:methionine-rich copper-binding protein CopC